PAIIQERSERHPEIAAVLTEGVAWLAGEGFVTLDDAQRHALLAEAFARPDSSHGRFCALVKDLTIDAYYSTREGLVTELGWHGNTALAEFPGCTHPEHQAD